MPTRARILGFSNRWYASALRHSDEFHLPSGQTIRLVSSPFFIATKLEALRGRGRGDFASSHDLEDIIAVVDGRSTIDAEAAAAPPALRRYLQLELAKLLASARFVEALPGHLPPDAASQARLPLVMDRLKTLGAL